MNTSPRRYTNQPTHHTYLSDPIEDTWEMDTEAPTFRALAERIEDYLADLAEQDEQE